MKLTLASDEGGVVSITVAGSVTQNDLDPGRDVLKHTSGDDVYFKTLLMDLSGADFLDSSGVGWLLTCHKRFEERGGRLVLHSVPPTVGNVLRVLRMERVLRIAENEKAARKSALQP